VRRYIDNAFDDRPRPGDVDNAHWGRFFDDLDEEGEKRLVEAYGVEAYEDGDHTTFRRDQTFIDAIWHARSTMENAAALFDEFERMQDRKRAELSSLCQLLEIGLGMTCRRFGRDVPAELAGASIVFLDLFLGAVDDDEAVSRAIDRVKGIVANRPQTPPSIVLLSASPRLEELGPRLRDEAELLGCQYRMLKKALWAMSS
jgi:hypothetical protein